MRLAKLITPKKIKALAVVRVLVSLILLISFLPVFSQDNSPYSRYGLGDLVPSTNINSRGMGGISAGFAERLSINFNNPASYSQFFAQKEQKSNKISYGRAILDVGLNLESRTLIEPNVTAKFKASNFLFSHLQVGVPLKSNWGLSFGFRPITRVSYKINKAEKIYDPNTGLLIDSASTLNEGDGGSYLPSIGTGYAIKINDKQSLSLGVNVGYLFGKKEYSARRSILNDTVIYTSGNFQTNTNFGTFYLNGGLQYQAVLNTTKLVYMTFGVYGNLKQNMNASQDIIRETYYEDPTLGNTRIDSVYVNSNVKGKITYPGSFTAGFTIQKVANAQLKQSGWLFGVDFTQNKWNDYRFYGQTDSVQNNWQLRVGAELRPMPKANYFSNATFRAGFFIGPDYIKVKEKLPVVGATIGMGLPLRNWNRQSPGQATLLNFALEYIKRGNDKNILKENLIRFSVGFSLSDFWFVKKKYE